jgi:hypothetical protein
VPGLLRGAGKLTKEIPEFILFEGPAKEQLPTA